MILCYLSSSLFSSIIKGSVHSYFLPVCGSFQGILSCLSVIFSLGSQVVSPPWLLHLSSSALGSVAPITAAEPWLFFLVELDVAMTPIPSPRSPPTMSSSRLLVSMTCFVCTRPNLALHLSQYASAKHVKSHMNSFKRSDKPKHTYANSAVLFDGV